MLNAQWVNKEINTYIKTMNKLLTWVIENIFCIALHYAYLVNVKFRGITVFQM